MRFKLTTDRCKLIAEIGLSHEGSLGFAFNFIKSAKIAGADMVKFQFHLPHIESSKDEPFRVKFSLQDKTRWDYWERTSFSMDEWRKIVEKCREEDIEFCVSVFSGASAVKMIDLGVSNIKLGSGDLTNLEIQEILVKWNGNLFISTGMATYEEIHSTIEFFQKNFKGNELTVFQCTSKYPTPFNEVGINVMVEISEKWDVNVGLSDHSIGIDSAKVAICFGADVIEKHVVFNKAMFGPDVTSSITFDELSELSRFRDNFINIMEKVDKNKIAEELENERKIFGRSLGLNRSFQKGEIISESDFCFRKPAGGLDWEDRKNLIGKKLKRDVELGEIIQLEYFD
jgi:N-acetylneuraminate synthase